MSNEHLLTRVRGKETLIPAIVEITATQNTIMTSIIQVTPATGGLYHDPNISAASAAQVTSLLQKNHDSFHVYWNDKGYHNHQVHYLLTAYALGASAPKLQNAFDTNAHYQRPLFPLNEERIRKLANDEYFISLLGCEDYFHDLVAFFERKFEKAGWQMVVQQYLFSRSKLAEELLVRLFAGKSANEQNESRLFTCLLTRY